MQNNYFFTLFTLISLIVVCKAYRNYEIKISSNTPAVLGSEVTFQADLYTDGKLVKDDYKVYWMDNAIPSHISNGIKSSAPHFEWTAAYPSDRYPPGTYEVQLEVQKWELVLYVPISSVRMNFNITALLNGDLELSQNGTVRENEFVASELQVDHTIRLKESDMALLKQNATYVQTFWFIDCAYVGFTENYTLFNQYKTENQKYNIEALVVASYEKIPEPTTTTTSTTTTTTTTTTTSTTTTTTPTTSTTTTPSTTTSTSTTTTKAPPVKRDVAKASEDVEIEPSGQEITRENATEALDAMIPTVPEKKDPIDQPFVCFNKSMVAPDPRKTYGYFSRSITVKHSIANVTITGNNWLHQGDLLSLKVKCSGSPPFQHCIKVHNGPYNITGNETCIGWLPTDACDFDVTHFLSQAQPYTLLVIIKNDVTKTINQVAVNIYEVKKQSQLSVIVVPVAFTLLAVIAVIFGFAYYIQNKKRTIVEVADFNFGETQSVDMEYKTFQQRLLDSIREACRWRAPNPGPSHLTGDSSLDYGSMT
ncbi:uncharacterized protein LOC132258962 isoform X2 [Phlebotomus argentipes]|uniref:uncharacterized protein LOC132258962 isoform X2 n=1 Tax=Phlebotomus argentipes TaxID=94469 RepID=UPI002892FB68|nr:uncharacterized protein LOC132258962 isoform X2 [Phlebotomus argentipes]